MSVACRQRLFTPSTLAIRAPLSCRCISGLWGGSRSRRRRNTSSRRANRYRLKQRSLGKDDAQDLIPSGDRFSLCRFLNPWKDLSRVLPTEELLYDRVESTTRTFGIVAALMGSLAAALMTMNSYDGYDADHVPLKRSTTTKGGYRHETHAQDHGPNAPTSIQRRDTVGFMEHVTFTHHVSGTSLLVSWGLQQDKLDDFYTACCAGSFYSGVLTTVISSVLNAWMAATPAGGIRNFVHRHSWFIVSMPALLGVSTSLAGTALFIGIDREHGTPVSYVGLAGSLLGGIVLGMVTGRGWLCTYRGLTEAVLRRERKIK